MRITDQQCAGSIIVTPAGRLDSRSYFQLRDRLLKHATDTPAALIVDLNSLDTSTGPTEHCAAARTCPSVTSGLSLFAAVWRQLSTWPVIPLHLACNRPSLLAQLATVSRFVPTHASVAAALAALADPPPRQRAELAVPAAMPSAALARRWLTEVLTGWGLDSAATTTDSLLADAVLIGSELVENLIRHAGGEGTLRVELHPVVLSIAVSDHHSRPPRLVESHSAGISGGRGLAVIDHLALAWGHHPRWSGGKVVWAVLAVPHRVFTGKARPRYRESG